MNSHENKNKLLVIKNMIDAQDSSVTDYIEGVLNEKVKTEPVWDRYLQNLPISSDFLNIKLTKMKGLGTNIEFFVSDCLSTIDFCVFGWKEKHDIYTILGVLLDNMIEALEVSENKLASILIYLEDNKVYGEFANSFNKKIELEKVSSGYSTKGEGHGYGLQAVKQIISQNDHLSLETQIVDCFFVQKLIIDLNLVVCDD